MIQGWCWMEKFDAGLVKSFVFFLYQSIFRADSNPSSRRDMTPYSLVAQSSQIYLSQVHVFPLSDIDGKLLFYATWRKTLYSVPWIGPVVWRLVGANPRLNFNAGFLAEKPFRNNFLYSFFLLHHIIKFCIKGSILNFLFMP